MKILIFTQFFFFNFLFNITSNSNNVDNDKYIRPIESNIENETNKNAKFKTHYYSIQKKEVWKNKPPNPPPPPPPPPPAPPQRNAPIPTTMIIGIFASFAFILIALIIVFVKRKNEKKNLKIKHATPQSRQDDKIDNRNKSEEMIDIDPILILNKRIDIKNKSEEIIDTDPNLIPNKKIDIKNKSEEIIDTDPNLIHNKEDFTPVDLIKIYMRFCSANKYSLSDSAIEKLDYVINNNYEKRGKNFEVARLIRNLFEKTIANRSRRLKISKQDGKETPSTIEAGDLPEDLK